MKKSSFLCVANWDSNVGYAWWLMESFWVKIAEHYHADYNVFLAYPSISKIPKAVKNSTLKIKNEDFTFNSWSSIFSQLSFIFKNNVEYIYFSDRSVTQWRYLFYRLAGVKAIIIHDHTPGLRTKPGTIKCLLKSVISRLPLINSQMCIGATDFVKNRLTEINCFPANRCFSAPNGIPLLSIEASRKKTSVHSLFNIPKNKKIIVSVGRANFYKGIDFSLLLLSELINEKKINCVHFLYLGDGPDLDNCLKEATKLGIREYVSFPGRVSNVEQILPECHVGFHPSKGEVGYSLSILEFMQAGLPVVVPDNPSVCGATEHTQTGLIYEAGNIEDAAYAMQKLLSDQKLCLSMGMMGRERVRTKYNLNECHKRLTGALDFLILSTNG